MNFLNSFSESFVVTLNLALCILTGILQIPLASRPKIARLVSLGFSLLLVASSLVLFFRVQEFSSLSMQAGSWAAPFGISFFIDKLGALMICVTALIGLCGSLACLATLNEEQETRYFYVFFHFLMAASVGAFSTGDIFNLYVWFEMLLISSFALLVIHQGTKILDGAVKYVSLSLLSSFLFLLGLGIVYNAGGTLQIRDLQNTFLNHGALMPAASVCILMAFLIKAGAFPFYQWLPGSYPHLPSGILAVFAGLLTKVGVFSLLRIFAAPVIKSFEGFQSLMIIVGLATMVFGVLAAIYQNDIKKILSVHIISQIGYILLGFAIDTHIGVAASILYLLHNMIVKTNLFFVSAWIEKLYGTCELSKLHSLASSHPFMAINFAIAALALVGVPPLSGFWAKFFTLQATLEAKYYISFFLCLAVGGLTLFSMTKIWVEAFWAPSGPEFSQSKKELKGRERLIWIPVIVLNSCAVLIGLHIEKVWILALEASNQILGARSLP